MTTTMKILHFILPLTCAVAAACVVPSAAAQAAFPTKPVKIVVPFAPGGTTDVLARLIGDKMGPLLGQAVIVENKPGAGGVLGTEFVARSEADGHTIGMATASTHAVNPALHAKLSYDAVADFASVGQIASVANVLVAGPKVKVETLQALIAHAKAQPGALSYGTPGNGSIGHFMGETLKWEAKVDLLHVPYKGAAPALNDLLAGTVDVMYDNLPTSLPHIQSGKIRALAVADQARSEALPNVPTFREAGLPATSDPAWFGLVVPAKTPPAVVEKLNAAMNKVLAMDDVKARLRSLTARPVGGAPDQLTKLIAREIEKNKTIAKQAGITGG